MAASVSDCKHMVNGLMRLMMSHVNGLPDGDSSGGYEREDRHRTSHKLSWMMFEILSVGFGVTKRGENNGVTCGIEIYKDFKE